VLPWWLPPEDIPARYSGTWLPAAVSSACRGRALRGRPAAVTTAPTVRSPSSPQPARARPPPLPPSYTDPRTPRSCEAAECGASGVVHGKTTVATRKRLLAVGTTGQAVWASSEHYAVLLTTAGPPPSGCVCVGGRGRLGARLSVAVTSCVVPGERKDRCGLRGTVDRGVPACGCPPQLAVAPASPAFRLTQLCAGGWRPDGASRRRRSRRGRS
jgi:hypothetical protein